MRYKPNQYQTSARPSNHHRAAHGGPSGAGYAEAVSVSASAPSSSPSASIADPSIYCDNGGDTGYTQCGWAGPVWFLLGGFYYT